MIVYNKQEKVRNLIGKIVSIKLFKVKLVPKDNGTTPSITPKNIEAYVIAMLNNLDFFCKNEPHAYRVWGFSLIHLLFSSFARFALPTFAIPRAVSSIYLRASGVAFSNISNNSCCSSEYSNSDSSSSKNWFKV